MPLLEQFTAHIAGEKLNLMDEFLPLLRHLLASQRVTAAVLCAIVPDELPFHLRQVVIGNRIRNVWNYYCIDLRLCPEVEKNPLSRIRRVNVGNRMEGNDVDGKVRFENREK